MYFLCTFVSRFYIFDKVRESGERVDVMHYHYTASGDFKGRWQQATGFYEDIMQEDERISYISVVRDHRSHFLSFYYYFVQPEVEVRVSDSRKSCYAR